MNPRLWYIRGLPLFASSENLAATLREIGRVQRWGHRAEVALRPDVAEVQVVLTGALELADGGYDAVARLTAGDLFGELAPGDQPCTLRAYDDLIVASFDRSEFESATDGLLGDLSANVGVVRRKALRVPVSSLLYTAPKRRLANVLLHFVESNGSVNKDSGTLEFQPRTRALARLSGLADPTVSDIVDEFRRDRIIEVGRTQLVVPSIERMRQLAIG